MKKIIAALLAAAMLTGALGGCVSVVKREQDESALSGELSKAERIDIYDGEDNLLRTLETGEELNDFFNLIDSGDDWDLSEETPEEFAPREAYFVFSQRPTETVLGGKPDPDERQEIVRLTLYEGSDTAYIKLLLFSFHMKLPEDTLEALRALAQPE